MSFRFKTILGIALIEFTLLMTLILSGLDFLSDSNEFQLQQRAQNAIKLLASATKEAILSNDLATLNSAVNEMVQNPEVVYTRISSNNIVLAEMGDAAVLRQKRDIDTSYASVHDNIYDVKTNIEVSGEIFGTIELGISTAFIDQLLINAKKAAYSLAAIEIALVAFFSFILGTYLTRQLKRLKEASEVIKKSGPGYQVDIKSHDEIADVAQSFNAMSLQLKKSYKDLNVSLKAHKNIIKVTHYNEAKITAILESSLDANITINAQDEIIEFNHIAESIFGWSKAEILGKSLNETLIPTEFKHAHKQGIQTYLSTGEGPVLGQRLELKALRKTGEIFPIEISISPIFSHDQTLFTAFVRDLTAQKEAEQEHTLARQQAEQANASKSRFLATMSHEIRSPLNAIITMNALLLETKLNQQQLEMVQTVNNGGEILMSLINDILDFSKIESGHLKINNEWFDLKKMVSNTVSLLSTQTDKKHLDVRCNISPQLKTCYLGDKQQTRQILINLFSNAIKFTATGYVQIDLDINKKNNGIVLTIIDTGIGIAEPDQQLIFKEFQQIEDTNKRRFGGTGLGLFIVYRLIKMMRGSITIKSKINKGSTFCVFLPLEGSDTAIENSTIEIPKIMNIDFENKNILLVEDSPTNQLVIKSLLQHMNLNVSCADNGKIAVELAKKQKFDLILMDLAMPEMNGIEATKYIRNHKNLNMDTFITAITANAFDEDKQQCLDAGMNDFMSKPININEFRAKFPHWIKASVHSEIEPKQYLDASVLVQLKEDTSAESLPKIVNIFITETLKREALMHKMHQQNNLSGLVDEAHTLKSSSASFGAITLQLLAKDIEAQAKQNNTGMIDSLMKTLSKTINKSLQAINQTMDHI